MCSFALDLASCTLHGSLHPCCSLKSCPGIYRSSGAAGRPCHGHACWTVPKPENSKPQTKSLLCGWACPTVPRRRPHTSCNYSYSTNSSLKDVLSFVRLGGVPDGRFLDRKACSSGTTSDPPGVERSMYTNELRIQYWTLALRWPFHAGIRINPESFFTRKRLMRSPVIQASRGFLTSAHVRADI